MILDKFYTDKYDNDIIFVNPDVTYGEFKKFVYGQIREFESSPIKNTILLGDNYFEFAVNFFASIFANKNIYLISDRTRVNHLNFEHILPKKPTQAEGTINTKIDPKNVMINFYTSGSTGEPKPIGKTLHNTEVEAYCTIEEFDIKEDTILVVSEQGYGKRSSIEDYRVTNRGGKGVKTMNITDKTGMLVSLKRVNDNNDLVIINKSGITIRVHVSDLRVMGRATQGVKLINLEKRNDEIASVCKVISEKDEEVVSAGCEESELNTLPKTESVYPSDDSHVEDDTEELYDDNNEDTDTEENENNE